MESIDDYENRAENMEDIERLTISSKPQKIKFRTVIVLRSINAPYVSNTVVGDKIKIPVGMFDHYFKHKVVEPVRRTKKEIKIKDNG